jgi:hypothetical protein
MGNTRNTGYLQNLVVYDASGNIVLPANLTINGNAAVATQSYVSTQINNLINGAPGLLDTLDELAAALGDDANFASTVTTSIAGKQAQLDGTGFVKVTGTTVSYDNSTYLTTSSASSTYLPLTGGTLTGALIVENNAITQDGTRPILTLQQSGNTKVFLGISSGASDLVIGDASGDAVFRKPASSGAFRFSVDGGTLSALVLASTGKATFSSTNQISQQYTGSPNTFEFGQYNTAGDASINNKPSTGILTFATSNTVRLTIASTGAATFSSSVGTTLGSGGIYFSGNASPDIAYIGYNYTNVNGTEATYQSSRSSWRQHFGNGSTNQWKVEYRAPLAAASSWTDYLTIASTGAATFSSSVTAQGNIDIIASSAPQLLFFESSSSYTEGMRVLRSNDKLHLTYGWNANEEALTVVGTGSTTGFVGIGTVSPSTRLNVSHPNHGIGISYMGGSALPSIAGLFTDSTSAQQGYGSLLIKSRTDYAGYSISFYTAGTANVIQERVRITSDGAICSRFGQSGTTARFDITPNLVLEGQSGVSSGRAGISLLSNGAAYGIIMFGSSTVSNTDGFVQYLNDTRQMVLGTADAARVWINSSGNVGINNNSPSHRLHVSGNIYCTDTVYGRNILPDPWAYVTAGSPSGAPIPQGYSAIEVNSPCDNVWRPVLSNINDSKVFMWVTLGDAASKDTASYTWQMVSPAYGVANMANLTYMDGGWNTGEFEFTYDTSGNNYRLLVRSTSYYSSGNTANGKIYFLRLQ